MDDRPKGTSTRMALTLLVALVLVVTMIWMLRDVGSGDVATEGAEPAAAEAPGDAPPIAD